MLNFLKLYNQLNGKVTILTCADWTQFVTSTINVIFYCSKQSFIRSIWKLSPWLLKNTLIIHKLLTSLTKYIRQHFSRNELSNSKEFEERPLKMSKVQNNVLQTTLNKINSKLNQASERDSDTQVTSEERGVWQAETGGQTGLVLLESGLRRAVHLFFSQLEWNPH